jgi:hypothetical protein
MLNLRAPRLACFPPAKIPCAQFTVGWVDPKASLNQYGEENVSFFQTDLELRIIDPVASCSAERHGLLSDYKCPFHKLWVIFCLTKLYEIN